MSEPLRARVGTESNGGIAARAPEADDLSAGRRGTDAVLQGLRPRVEDQIDAPCPTAFSTSSLKACVL